MINQGEREFVDCEKADFQKKSEFKNSNNIGLNYNFSFVCSVLHQISMLNTLNGLDNKFKA